MLPCCRVQLPVCLEHIHGCGSGRPLVPVLQGQGSGSHRPVPNPNLVIQPHRRTAFVRRWCWYPSQPSLTQACVPLRNGGMVIMEPRQEGQYQGVSTVEARGVLVAVARRWVVGKELCTGRLCSPSCADPLLLCTWAPTVSRRAISQLCRT